MTGENMKKAMPSILYYEFPSHCCANCGKKIDIPLPRVCNYCKSVNIITEEIVYAIIEKEEK